MASFSSSILSVLVGNLASEEGSERPWVKTALGEKRKTTRRLAFVRCEGYETMKSRQILREEESLGVRRGEMSGEGKREAMEEERNRIQRKKKDICVTYGEIPRAIGGLAIEIREKEDNINWREVLEGF